MRRDKRVPLRLREAEAGAAAVRAAPSPARRIGPWPYLWLLVMGMTGTISHLAMGLGFQDADASLVMPVDFSRLIWLPPDLTSEEERQVQFIERLHTDVRIQEGADLLQTSLEDFKSVVLRRAAPEEKEKMREEDLIQSFPDETELSQYPDNIAFGQNRHEFTKLNCRNSSPKY